MLSRGQVASKIEVWWQGSINVGKFKFRLINHVQLAKREILCVHWRFVVVIGYCPKIINFRTTLIDEKSYYFPETKL